MLTRLHRASLNFKSRTWTYFKRFVSQSRPEISQSASLTDIGTRAIFNEEHDIFRQNVRKFYNDEIVPNIPRWENEGQVGKEIWEKVGKFGLLGIDVPTVYGGSGSDFITSVIPVEELAYILFTGLGISIHFNYAQRYILKYGSEEQRNGYLPRMVLGQCVTSVAMTEPGAGSDLQGIKTHAKRSGSDWILNGSKTYIANGLMCDLALVLTVTDPTAAKAAHGISYFLVEDGTKGFKKRRLDTIGWRAQDTAELTFEDVRLPQSALLGELNHGFYYLMNEIPRERLAVAIGSQAACEAMFEETRKFALDRKVFGRRLADLQVTQHKLAEMKTEICIGRAFVDQCIQLFQRGKLDASTTAMVKYWVTELQNRVAYDCTQLHGGAGYMREYPIARAYVDAKVQTLFAGSSEVLKDIIARKITN